MATGLNAVYSSPSMKRRYEVWFLRLGLADGSGAWWFRYLLMNPGREGCKSSPLGMPVQVWATWFPRDSHPQHWIQGFTVGELTLSQRHREPFHFKVAGNLVDEQSCRGQINVEGHEIRWDLRYQSRFHVTMSNKGWIGFSRTPHSDAQFSGEITLDGRVFRGDPLGFGVQGHNCGFRHRNFWTWTDAVFPNLDGSLSTFEALVYEMPMGLVFRSALLWHGGESTAFNSFREEFRDRTTLEWRFRANGKMDDKSKSPLMEQSQASTGCRTSKRIAQAASRSPITVWRTRGSHSRDSGSLPSGWKRAVEQSLRWWVAMISFRCP